MKFIVTGGRGFIGSHLVELLRNRVAQEVVIVDKIANHYNYINLVTGVRHFLADISDPDIMMKIVQKDDIVFHLAAQPHVDLSYEKPLETTKSNVLGTQSVLNACHRNEAKKLIVMSTDEVYGSADVIDDNAKLDPTNPYSATKAAADMIVNSYKHMYPDMFIATLRSNNIIGPRQFIRNIVPRFALQALTGRDITLHGKGEARRRYLWVKDAVEALWLIYKKSENHKIYNIGHPEVMSNLEVAQTIVDYLGKGNIVCTEDRIYNDTIYPHNSVDIEHELGWRHSLNPSESIPLTVDWYKKNLQYWEPHYGIL